MTTPQSPLHTDDTAACYPITGPSGGPAVQIVGTHPADPSTFEPWAAQLTHLAEHPAIAAVPHAGLGPDGRPSIVVDAEGSTLAERLVNTGPLAVGEAIANAASLAGALDAVHRTGARHGLVAPSTVLFDGFGRPHLAGFDATAPGLGLGRVDSRFNPLDPQPGPAADVYALAATTYTALGGRLPYAADPADPRLRHQPIGDLPGVPPEVTGLLRAALDPDPNGRPGAAQIHERLSAIDVPHVPSAAPPMPAELVGVRGARPVTAGVVQVNAAAPAIGGGTSFPVSGGPGGYPASAAPFSTSGAPGAYPTSGAPGAYPAPQSPAFGAPAPTGPVPYGQAPWGAPAAPKKSKGPLIAILAVVGVIILVPIVILAASGVIFTVGAEPDDPGVATPSPTPPPLDEGVKEVDLGESDIYIVQSPDRLSDGVAGDNGEYTLAGSPEYADADADGDLDAAALIEYAGDDEYDPWSWVQVWLYDPDRGDVEPLEFEATWQWTCSELEPLDVEVDPAYPNTFEITRSYDNYCDGGNFHTSETIHVGVVDEAPVQMDVHHSAVIQCRADANATEFEVADVTGKAEPLAVPDPGAPVVVEASEYSKIEVYYDKDVDRTINNGYAYGVIFFHDGLYGCGWVPWDVVP